MKRWDLRPFETKNLFNPAFCALLMMRSLEAFELEDARGIPFSLSLLILPLSLHKGSREVFAPSSRSYLLKTIEDNPQLLIAFAERVTEMLPFTFEAFGLAMHMGCFQVTPEGRLIGTPKTTKKAITGTEESISCQRVARLLGREFARIGDRSTIYTAFGIRP
ncbi:three component ABC system middle component [Pseudomonas bubulae]|uniref:three component ABC system middle component n=1 Tax=Pseudomonas bubulae TaxID=2316085 RepID=UPI0010310046|nr:three component ABC system middle component [Pseudomonas bubulae]